MEPFKKGQAYYIRTLQYHWTGRVVTASDAWLVLEDAAWIADGGRYSQAVDEAHLREVEPRDGQVIVSTASIIDAVEWLTPLPRRVK